MALDLCSKLHFCKNLGLGPRWSITFTAEICDILKCLLVYIGFNLKCLLVYIFSGFYVKIYRIKSMLGQRGGTYVFL